MSSVSESKMAERSVPNASDRAVRPKSTRSASKSTASIDNVRDTNSAESNRMEKSDKKLVSKGRSSPTNQRSKLLPDQDSPRISRQVQLDLGLPGKGKGKLEGKGKQEDNTVSDDCPCIKCGGVIHDGVKALQCDFCGEWVCLLCTALPQQVYDAVVDNVIPNFIWSCDTCVSAVPTIKNLSRMLQDVKSEQGESRKQMNELHTRVDSIEKSLDDKIQTAIDDYRDRETRKCNIILHNVPESDCEQPKERKEEDESIVVTMLNDSLNLAEVKLESVIRLGKKSEGRNRLTKVTLDSVKSKREILNAAKNLKGIEEWSNIFITPDMTPKEREKNKELREELKRRRENGEEGIAIRRGKIVPITQQHKERKISDGAKRGPSADQTFRQ